MLNKRIDVNQRPRGIMGQRLTIYATVVDSIPIQND